MNRFHDRSEAGRELARALVHLVGRRDLVVLGLPRGGVPVAFEVAGVLGAPLDVFVVRKLGVPGQEELAFGALASGGVRVLNDEIVRLAGIDEAAIEAATRLRRLELDRLEAELRGERPLVELRGRTAVLIDDGLATGATMHAAVSAARALDPAGVIVAAPVGSAEALARIRPVADRVVCLLTPEPFLAVGAWYANFAQTTDREVRELLARNRQETPRPGHSGPPGGGPK